MRLRKRRRTILKISMPFPLCTTLTYRRSTRSTLVPYLNYRLCFLQCLNKALNLSVSLLNHSVPFLECPNPFLVFRLECPNPFLVFRLECPIPLIKPLIEFSSTAFSDLPPQKKKKKKHQGLDE